MFSQTLVQMAFSRVVRRGSHSRYMGHGLDGSVALVSSTSNESFAAIDTGNPLSHNRHCGTAKERRADRSRAVQELWRKFFADPSQWWDNRSRKKNPKFPDFVHSVSREGLWTERYLNPPWVEDELTSLKRGDPSSHCPVRAAYKTDSAAGTSSSLCSSHNFCIVPKDTLEEGSGVVPKDTLEEGGSPPPSSRVSLGTIKKLCDEQRLDEVLQSLDLMQQGGSRISSDIFYCVLHGCIKHKDLISGRKLYYLILRGGLEANTFLGSHLIRMFALCGSLFEADEVFSRLPKHNVFAWSAVIMAHSKYGQAVQAIKLYHQMQTSCVKPDEYIFASVLKACAGVGALEQGQLAHAYIIEGHFDSDPCVCNALTDMYTKCGSLTDARRVFDRMCEQDAVALTVLISGYAQHGYTVEVFQLFQGMLEKGMEPDNFIFSSLLKACSSGASLDQGKLIYTYVVERGYDVDAIIGSALIDMYVKCGNFRDACKVFGMMPDNNLPMWNALTAGFASQSEHGLLLNYVDDLQRQGLKPDELGFACLLSTCSRMGLVGEGCNLFQWMQKDHGVTPTLEHFTCMVDLLGRVGHLTQAEDLLQCMPVRSDAVGWATVLSHCRTFGNMKKGKQWFSNSIINDGITASVKHC